MYTSEILERDAQEQVRKRDEQNRAAWEEILDAEDVDVSEGESFYQRILAFCENRITREKFDLLTMVNPQGFDYTDQRWHQGTKANLIAQLMKRKREQLAPHGVLDPRDAVELRNFEVNLHNLSKKELRAKRREIAFRAEVKTAADAERWLARHRLLESQQKFFFASDGTKYERLPPNVVPRGFVQAVPRNARYYRFIADAADLQRDVRQFGAEQVTERIQSTLSSLRGE